MLLATSIKAKRILEVGTLAGWAIQCQSNCSLYMKAFAKRNRYSAIWLGKALPKDGELITLELVEKHAQVRYLGYQSQKTDYTLTMLS
jgi:hypothetical protein